VGPDKANSDDGESDAEGEEEHENPKVTLMENPYLNENYLDHNDSNSFLSKPTQFDGQLIQK